MAMAAGLLAAGGAAVVLEAMPSEEIEISEEQQFDDSWIETTYELADFDKISTLGPQDVFVTQGDEFSVRAEGSSRVFDEMQVVVENGELILRLQGNSFLSDWDDVEDTTFHITMPQLQRVTIAGAGDVGIEGLRGTRFDGVINGAGEMLITGLDVDEVEFGIFGAGDITVDGTAGTTSVSIGGAGDVDGDDLVSRTASVSIEGVGDVGLHVEETASISIAGAGDVDISGPASCSVSRMGSGDVACEGPGGD